MVDMKITELHPVHEQRAIAKADRAIEAIELVATFMVAGKAAPNRLAALIQIHNTIAGTDPNRPAAARTWHQISLAAGHLEGVEIHDVDAEAHKLPTYNTSRPFIEAKLWDLIVATANETKRDRFHIAGSCGGHCSFCADLILDDDETDGEAVNHDVFPAYRFAHRPRPGDMVNLAHPEHGLWAAQVTETGYGMVVVDLI